MPGVLAADAWRWQPHPEVWLLVGGVIALSVYVVRVIGPKVVPEGEPVLNRRQTGFLVAGIVILWVASDWPVHDVGERYLYSVHMAQHLLLSYVMPALFVVATPTWLARLVVPVGSQADAVLRRLAHPVVAGLVFNAVVVLTHWPALVNASVESAPLHYAVHLLVVASAVIMWVPVCGPFPELRLSYPAQMAYLFAMSILPTVPAGWLTFAEGAVYRAYDTPERLWGISVAHDQQAAGMVMKVIGGFYLWGIIAFVFFRWAYLQQRDPSATDTTTEATTDRPLTYDAVREAFERSGPAPSEPAPPRR